MALSGRFPGRGLAVILVLAALARLAVIVPALHEPPDDPDAYLVLARSLAGGRGFTLAGRPTAYRPPLYPLMLAPIVGGSGGISTRAVLGLNLALGLATVVLTALAARRWGLNDRGILLAAAIVALDPVLLRQGRSVMTETPSAFLLAATLAATAGPRGAALGGLGFGLLTLCRPSFLPAAGLAALGAVVAGTGDLRGRVRRGLILAGATSAVMAPWALRNAVVLGEPVWTTTHGGYTLALANNPVYYAEVLDGPPGAVWEGPNQRAWWDETARATAGMSEPRADRTLSRRGLAMLSGRPASFARASAARLGRFWGIAPAAAVYPLPLRLAAACWTAPLWVALVLGLGRRPSWEWPRIAAPAAVVAMTVVHTFYWTDMRMRAPIMPAIALIAAGGPAGGSRRRKAVVGVGMGGDPGLTGSSSRYERWNRK